MASTPLSSSHEHHIVPTFIYVRTLVLLLILMLLTVGVAEHPFGDLGPISGTVVNQVVALIIAFIKAGMVIWFFMGIKWATDLIRLWAMTGFVWVTLMSIMLADYTTRKYEIAPSWEAHEGTALPRIIHGATPQPIQDPNEANLRPRE